MSEFDNPQPQDWSELEGAEDYRDSYLIALRAGIEDKKYGEDFMTQYYMMMEKKMKEATTDEERLEAINSIEEVSQTIDDLDDLKTEAEIVQYGKKIGVELTEEDYKRVKRIAIEDLLFNKKSNEV